MQAGTNAPLSIASATSSDDWMVTPAPPPDADPVRFETDARGRGKPQHGAEAMCGPGDPLRAGSQRVLAGCLDQPAVAQPGVRVVPRKTIVFSRPISSRLSRLGEHA